MKKLCAILPMLTTNVHHLCSAEVFIPHMYVYSLILRTLTRLPNIAPIMVSNRYTYLWWYLLLAKAQHRVNIVGKKGQWIPQTLSIGYPAPSIVSLNSTTDAIWASNSNDVLFNSVIRALESNILRTAVVWWGYLYPKWRSVQGLAKI